MALEAHKTNSASSINSNLVLLRNWRQQPQFKRIQWLWLNKDVLGIQEEVKRSKHLVRLKAELHKDKFQ
jgi:hypothetical protein